VRRARELALPPQTGWVRMKSCGPLSRALRPEGPTVNSPVREDRERQAISVLLRPGGPALLVAALRALRKIRLLDDPALTGGAILFQPIGPKNAAQITTYSRLPQFIVRIASGFKG
jgi:hypothetical protein